MYRCTTLGYVWSPYWCLPSQKPVRSRGQVVLVVLALASVSGCILRRPIRLKCKTTLILKYFAPTLEQWCCNLRSWALMIWSILTSWIPRVGVLSFRVPDKFSRQGVNKEFQRVKFPLLPPNGRNCHVFSIACCFQLGPLKKMEIRAGGWVLELGNPGTKGFLAVWEIQSEEGRGGGGGSKMLAIRREGVYFFWNNPIL